jgi:hypothetical protein
MLAVVLSACATMRRDHPAVLINPTPESRSELARIVGAAFHGAPITLAPDALTKDGTLIVERAPARTAEGIRMDGRDPGRPQHFRLVKRGSRCVLVRESTGERWTLKAATCAPAE